MEWNNESYNKVAGLGFASQPEISMPSIYNYSYDQFPEETKQQQQQQQPQAWISAAASGQMLPSTFLRKNNVGCNNIYGQELKKKRLSNEQLESLENSFQEETKLDPDRKMKLSKDLGLHPRQIAVWFQNRRARWKSKQLESLYDALKQEFDAVSREKQKLQKEVMALRAILAKNQISPGYTNISGEETVESTSARSSDNQASERKDGNSKNNYINVLDYCNPMMVTTPPYNWAALP